MTDFVRYETTDGITTITLYRADCGNLVSNQMGGEIAGMIDAARLVRPTRGSVTLGDPAGKITTLEIACSRYPCRGRLQVDRLIEQYGARNCLSCG